MASGTTVGFSPQYNGPSLFRLPLITMITVKKETERNKQDKQVTNEVLVRTRTEKNVFPKFRFRQLRILRRSAHNGNMVIEVAR